jgi:RimJ/RimL family protein N-acetyltransferase/predicted enzyme related to lactoylglutathione lyase
MIAGIDFVALPVHDMARARAFYEGTLGLKPGEVFGDGAFVEYELGGGCLALDASPAIEPIVPAATGVVAIAAPNAAAGELHDPEGNRLCLRRGAPALDHVALPVQDLARARAFYEETLGLQGDGTYTLPDGSCLKLVAGKGPVTSGTLGLAVSELEAVFSRLAPHALARDVMASEVCHFTFIRDSEGNTLNLHRRRWPTYLESDNLILRLFEESDAAAYRQVRDESRAHLVDALGWGPEKFGDPLAEIRALREHHAARRSLPLGIFDRADGRLLGAVGLVRPDWEARTSEIGIWLGVKALGRGFASEAARRLVRHAFEALGLRRIELKTNPANTHLRESARRHGFTFEGLKAVEPGPEGPLSEIAVYALAADDYRPVSASMASG